MQNQFDVREVVPWRIPEHPETNAADRETDEAGPEIATGSRENLRAAETEAVHEKHHLVGIAHEAVTGSRQCGVIVVAQETATRDRRRGEVVLEAATGSHQHVVTIAALENRQSVGADQAREAETSAHLHAATVLVHETAIEDRDQYPRKIPKTICRSCNRSF